jgi:hypothetical protein
MLLTLLLPTAVLASEPVLVSRFEAAEPRHEALAHQLPGRVDARLRATGEIAVLQPRDVPYIQGKAGADYMAACPSERVLGCSFALAEVASARWAVTGVVRNRARLDDLDEPMVEVELIVLDIEEQEEAWSLLLPYSRAAEDELVGWAVLAVQALAAGEPPPMPTEEPEPDLREDEPFDPEQDLSELERELGEVGHPEGVEDLAEGRRAREPLTMEELLEAHGEDEPWLDMDLSAQEYLRWWNSGWGYRTWQEKRRGRKGQITVRGLAGGGGGPRGGAYHAQYAMDDANWRTVLEYYAWQAATEASGLSLGLNLGYGVAPSLDLELSLGTHWGSFDSSVTKEYLGEDPATVVDDSGLQGVLELGAAARVVPMPFSRIRPVLGAGVVMWRGSRGDTHAELPPPPVELPIPAANTLLGASLLVGGELTLHDSVGVVVQAPMQLFFSGTEANVHDENTGAIAHKLAPPDAPVFGWALQAGIQLHFGKD